MKKGWKKNADILVFAILFATGILYTIHASREANYKLYLMEEEFEQMRQESEEREAVMREIEYRDWCLKNGIHFSDTL